MIVIKCDSCFQEFPRATELHTGSIRVHIGETLVLNTPSVDRCKDCLQSVVTQLKTVVGAIDDTKKKLEQVEPNTPMPNDLAILIAELGEEEKHG
jgi:hypothetical protein